jgi:Family of unknown function (DUF5677)
MDVEDSIIIREFQKRYNDAVIQSNFTVFPDAVEIENSIVADQRIVPASLRREITSRLHEVSDARITTARGVRNDVAHVWGGALDCFDRFLAFADLINSRFVDVIFRCGSSVLKAKNPRPDPVALTGAYLQCVLLLSLYGKSCSIATEISTLLRDGYPDAAISRLRTLYEHLVIMMVLHNDQTYETIERYQDHAAFEVLSRLRAERRNLANPVFSFPAGYDREVAKQLAEATSLANVARAKWGKSIEEQYEWARPALASKKKQRKIVFSDLESAAGMTFLRVDYLHGNERIHAGAYSVINHLDLKGDFISPTRPRRSDTVTQHGGSRTALLLGWAARAAGRTIAWETEEYDEFLYVFEMQRAADEVANTFFAVDLDASPART